MNRPTHGPILLVGEGDFSLSIALNKQLPDVSMVSSALLDENSINVHKKARENIEVLRTNGVVVHLGVDATKLEADERINKTGFSRILFNFPHIGGKSNIKRNRELLKKFFQSAVECLTEDGDICLSLCRGQGGTPADIPMRQWSDSWQVVAMAAYSELTLVDTVPFVAKDFPEYGCTGFRSRDQFFHTEGAVTHVFRKLMPRQLPTDVICSKEVLLDGNVYHTNSYVVEAIIKMRETLSFENHPVNVTSRFIEKVVKRGLGQEILTEDTEDYHHVISKPGQNVTFNYLVHRTKPCKILNTIENSDASDMRDPSNHKYFKPCDTSSQTIRCDACTTEDTYSAQNTDDTCIMYSMNNSIPNNTDLLRTNILESMIQTDCFTCQEGKHVTLVKGDTYRRCTISPEHTPQHFEMVFWQRNFGASNFLDTVKASLQSSLSSENVYCEALGTTSDDSGTQSIQEIITVEGILFTHVITENPLSLPCNTAYDLQIDNENKSGLILSEQSKSSETTVKKVPFAYLGSLKTDASVQLCVCLVDILCQAMYSVSDPRLLWSTCPELLSQFTKQSSFFPIQPVSLYVPEWKHDVSFWKDSEIEFNELTYMDVVRDHLGDCVKEVVLMNIWTPDGEKRTSRCYRQLHQPCDQAVSYHRAHEFQRLLRLKVAHVLKIELR